MSDSPVHAAFPSGPLIDATTGEVTPAWRGFFVALYTRTGAATGSSMTVVQSNIDAEAAARVAGDAHLQGEIDAVTGAIAQTDVVTMQSGRSASDSAALVRVTLPAPYTTRTLSFAVDANPVQPTAFLEQVPSDVTTPSLVTGKLRKLDVSSGTMIDLPGVAFTWYATGV